MNNNRSGILVGGWSCLIIGLTLAIWQPVALLISLALFLAAFVLAVVAIAKRQFLGGGVLLLLTLFLPVCAVRYGFSLDRVSTPHIAVGASPPAADGVAPKSPSPTWQYSHWPDPMGRGMTRIAEIDSTNILSFRFPYSGEQHARLVIVNSAKYGLQVQVSIRSGQFMCPGYEGCTVETKLDDQAIVAMHASAAADGDPTVLFLPDPENVVSHVLSAKTFRVEAPFWQEGNQTLIFSVDNLDPVQVLMPPKAP